MFVSVKSRKSNRFHATRGGGVDNSLNTLRGKLTAAGTANRRLNFTSSDGACAGNADAAHIAAQQGLELALTSLPSSVGAQ